MTIALVAVTTAAEGMDVAARSGAVRAATAAAAAAGSGMSGMLLVLAGPGGCGAGSGAEESSVPCFAMA